MRTTLALLLLAAAICRADRVWLGDSVARLGFPNPEPTREGREVFERRGYPGILIAERDREYVTIDGIKVFLDDGIRACLMAAFEVPAAWKPEARIQATIPVLQGCRDSTWAFDPSLSFGLINTARSDIFRLQESVSGGSRSASINLDHSLSVA